MRWVALVLAGGFFIAGLSESAFGARHDTASSKKQRPPVEDLRVFPRTSRHVAPGRMLHAHLMRRIHAALDRREKAFEALDTTEKIALYQKRVRAFFLSKLGDLPERTPLDAQVVGRLARDGYDIEKVIYQSQPRHYVTALLYLPRAKPPYPGVLVPCGHTHNGKAGYQEICILLTQQGMAALCYDPIEQGERHQLLDSRGKPRSQRTQAHNLVGVGSILLGRNTATFRIWDGIRGIDYLTSRPEIDPKRIGCTGNSGGGTLTSYLMALDDRIVCAAPSCYVTNFRRLLDTIGPQDAEQLIHGQVAFGLDHADYLHLRAPRPTLLCTATRDFFDIQGAWATFREAKRLYTRLGFPERVDLVENDAKHGFSGPLRVGAAQWMQRWLLHVDGPVREPDYDLLTDKQARCTPRGEFMLLDGARSTFDLNDDLEAKFARKRKLFWRDAKRDEALAEVRRVTGIRTLDLLGEPQVRKTGTVKRDGYHLDKLLIHRKPDVWLPGLLFHPEKKRSGQAYLYLHESGKHVDAAPGGPIEKLVRQGHVVLAVDVRGIGETRAPSSRKYAKYLGHDWRETSLAYLLGTSPLAMRAEDILVCARFLKQGEGANRPTVIHLVSHGALGPPALHAAALQPELFASVSLHRCLRSWSDVVHTPMARRQYANLVHGALRVYDLPDLLRALPPNTTHLIEPVDARHKPIASPRSKL